MNKDIILDVQNLTVRAAEKTLLKDVSFNVVRGARHLIRGHNGGGKSTLAAALAGNPEFETSGKIIFDGADVTGENATNRALRGIFLGAQNVPEIPGLSLLSFFKHSAIAHTHFKTGRDLSMGEFLARIEEVREKLSIPREWLNRGVNVGFSGGERKRLMLMQLMMTAPQLAILDEPDSGADLETQQLIAQTIAQMKDTTFLFISHQQKFIDMISPTDITTIKAGQIYNEKD